MTEALRAVVDRLRRRAAGETLNSIYGRILDTGRSSVQSLYCDRIAVVDVYLAEHPPDDDEPYTDEWVATLKPTGHWAARHEYSWIDNMLRYSAWAPGKADACYIGWYIEGQRQPTFLRHIKTRGDVRRLLKALGIEI